MQLPDENNRWQVVYALIIRMLDAFCVYVYVLSIQFHWWMNEMNKKKTTQLKAVAIQMKCD